MTHRYAIQDEILEFLAERPTADTTRIRRHLAYSADMTITYDALEPHLEMLEAEGHIDGTRSPGEGTTYYRVEGDAAVQPQTASD